MFVRTAKSFGVLTAGHVCRCLKEAAKEHRLRWAPQWALRNGLAPISVFNLPPLLGVQEEYDSVKHVPDYGCLRLAPHDGRDLEARATFINITPEGPSRKQPDYELECNAWVAAGYLAERSDLNAPRTKTLCCIHGIGGPETLYERDGRRYFYILSTTGAENPRDLGGMSGSGVWEVPTSSEYADGPIHIGEPILRGITFYQDDDPEVGRAGDVAFYAHELETIADDVARMLDEGQEPIMRRGAS